MGLCVSNTKLKNDNEYTVHKSVDQPFKSILTGFKFSKGFYKGDNEEEHKVQHNINFEPVGKGVGLPFENYSIERPIFESTTEAILLARHKLTQTLRTMKIINKEVSNDESEKLIIQQINVLKKIDHPNIIKFYESYQDEHYFHIIKISNCSKLFFLTIFLNSKI